MAEQRLVNPFVAQFRRGGVPRDLRLMAAQGALPLKTEDLVELLHHLLSDVDTAIAAASSATLLAVAVAEMVPIVRDRETLPGVLAWALKARSERELREGVLQNPSLPDEAVEAEAPHLPEDLAELVVINQVRLLRRTSLLEALEKNPSLNNDQRRRLRELRETFHIGEAAPAEAPVPAPPPPVEEAAPEPPPPAEPEPEVQPAMTEGDAVVYYLSEEEQRELDKVSTVQRIYRLNTAEKIITALKGTREERAILIRDPNRIVGNAVLGSPRLTEVEIESFAAMKNVSDEILRNIGNHREWTKRYGVVSGLVRNPRTPIAVALGLVSRLNPRDLKALAVDRNVPEVIRRQAQKFVRTTYESKK
jgi:hypothetical protein